MIRVNLVTDIRPGLPQTGQERFRFLGLTPEGLVLLSHAGKLIHARMDGKPDILPAPGDFFTAKVKQAGDQLELSLLRAESSKSEARAPEIPREILGVFAELLHKDDLPAAEILRLHAYPMSDFLVVPGTLQEKKRRGSLQSGHGKLTGPYYFLLRTRFDKLGEIGILLYADNPDFSGVRALLTAPNEYVRARLAERLRELREIDGRVISNSTHVVDRSA
ncbi:MAG TPA: hypothetical protein PKE49_15625 [Leptospiraceae bacterium]|nr:hypothetical protein [Leptospiraceae bacterium]